MTGPATPDTEPLIPLSRIGAPVYSDAAGGLVDRGNPRDISNAVSRPEYARPADPAPLSTLAVAMLQLLASHEIAQSPTGPELVNIPVGADDPVAQVSGGTTVMLQDRSLYSGPADEREQLNVVTHIFDGSTVYGSDKATTAALRALDGTGRMKVGPGGGLPIIEGRPKAGDARAEENPNLQAMHTLFLHEHNRLADRIAAECADQGLSCSDDEIFEGARRLVAATQEKIFYDELLPVFLNTDDLSSLLPDPAVRNGVSGAINEFTAAAGRIGHTLLPEVIQAQSPGSAPSHFALSDCFFNSGCLGGVTLEDHLFGLSRQEAQPVDSVVVDPLRNALVPGADANFLIDLYATNVNRGRDHGLPDYMSLRDLLGFEARPIEELLPGYVLAAFPDYLVTGIDAIVGLFAEFRQPAQYLGNTARAIWALQFMTLRDEHSWLDPQYELAGYLDTVSMAGLISWNTGLDTQVLGENVFVAGPTPVPLPAGWLLLATGGMLLMKARRRA